MQGRQMTNQSGRNSLGFYEVDQFENFGDKLEQVEASLNKKLVGIEDSILKIQASMAQKENLEDPLNRVEATLNNKLLGMEDSILKIQGSLAQRESTVAIKNGPNKGFLHASFNIDDLSNTKNNDAIYSKSIKLAGAQWDLAVYKDGKDGEEKTLGAYLGYKPDSTSISHTVDFTIRLLGSLRSVEHDIRYCFASEPDWNGYGSRLLKWSTLVDFANGFVDEKGNFKVQVEFSVRGKTNSEALLDAEFLTSYLVETNCILLVEGYRFPINRMLLSGMSSYFEKLFFGEFREKDQSEIVMKDVCAVEFLHLLKAMYPPGITESKSEDVNRDNVECLLRLADYYQVKVVSNQCLNYLMKCPVTEIPMADKLIYAQDYGLSDLLEQCIKEFKTFEDVKKLRETSQYSRLSQDIKCRVYENCS